MMFAIILFLILFTIAPLAGAGLIGLVVALSQAG